MAGDPGLDIRLQMSGGTANQIADLSLGGQGSNFHVRGIETTIAANVSAGARRIFPVQALSSGWPGYWMVIRNGNSGGHFSPITDIDIGANWFELLDPLPASAAIGDGLFGHTPGNEKQPFGIATPEECALGTTQYWGGYIASAVANPLGFGCYLDERNPGPWTIEISTGTAPVAGPPFLNVIPDRYTAPDLTNMIFGGARSAFGRPMTYETRMNPFDYTASGWVPIWVKATLPPNSRRQSKQCIAIVAADQATLRAPLLLVLGTEGFTPELTLTQTPTIYIRGGARFRANVKSVETGLAVPDLPVAMRQNSGPGTFYPPASPSETNEVGDVVGHYTAPTDVGEIGQTIEIEAEV